MNTQVTKRVFLIGALLLAVPLAAGGAGCRGGSASAAKDGQKFPAVKPPADYVAERERLRRNAAPPGPSHNPPRPAGPR